MANLPKPIVPGNINVSSIAPIKNSDGTYSTVRSISVGTDRGEALIPTVIDGKVVPDSTAIRIFKQTGKHLGIFKTANDADKFAIDLHNQESRRIAKIIAGVRAKKN